MLMVTPRWERVNIWRRGWVVGFNLENGLEGLEWRQVGEIAEMNTYFVINITLESSEKGWSLWASYSRTVGYLCKIY